MWGFIDRDRHLRIPSQKYQLGEMTCSGNVCAKFRPVDIVLQIAYFLSIKDSLSCKEPADLEDKAARNLPHTVLHLHTEGGDGRRCDSKVYHCSLKMEVSIL